MKSHNLKKLNNRVSLKVTNSLAYYRLTELLRYGNSQRLIFIVPELHSKCRFVACPQILDLGEIDLKTISLLAVVGGIEPSILG
jgi:hypothetical protein